MNSSKIAARSNLPDRRRTTSESLGPARLPFPSTMECSSRTLFHRGTRSQVVCTSGHQIAGGADSYTSPPHLQFDSQKICIVITQHRNCRYFGIYIEQTHNSSIISSHKTCTYSRLQHITRQIISSEITHIIRS